MKYMLAVALAVAATGCSDGTPDPRNIKPEEAPFLAKMLAEEVIKPKLRDPDSAVFSDLEIYSETDDRSIILCGKVNSKNAFGGLTGPQRFVAGGTVVIEEQLSAAEMNVIWTTFCHP